MKQLSIFDVEKHWQECWEFKGHAIDEAADMIIQLFKEGATQVTFLDVVKQKTRLIGQDIPGDYIRTVADQVDALTFERLRIKDHIEERGNLHLTVVDAQGRPSLRGGSPCGFALRLSAAGKTEADAQLHMAVRNVVSVARREMQVGRLQPEGVMQLLLDAQQEITASSSST